MHAPGPEKVFRWRIELDCGCIHEVLTSGRERLPVDARWRDWRPADGRLPAGQFVCWHEGASHRGPYRAITEWGDRKDDRPPDPVEPPERWADLGPEFWARFRRDRPRAVWSVTLSCGHTTTVTVDDLAWKPADGPVRREVTPDELAKEFARLDEGGAQGVDNKLVEHAKRWWADGCPEPGIEAACHTCTVARQIVAYQPVGWLAQPKQKPKVARPPSRETVKRQLREAERQVAALQEQLARLDTTDTAPADDES
jgi:hypothetical protein